MFIYLFNLLVLIFEQALRANTDLSLSQAQHLREVQQLREQVGIGTREQLAHMQTVLAEQQSRTRQLEEQLRSQIQQASTQLNLQQVNLLYSTCIHTK